MIGKSSKRLSLSVSNCLSFSCSNESGFRLSSESVFPWRLLCMEVSRIRDSKISLCGNLQRQCPPFELLYVFSCRLSFSSLCGSLQDQRSSASQSEDLFVLKYSMPLTALTLFACVFRKDFLRWQSPKIRE